MVGKNLSHYKILEELGRGGMGIVYKAEDTKLDRTVAIKVLPSAALASEEDRGRFYREAKAAAQLHHPNIAVVHEIDEAVPSDAPHGTEASPFIAMEFIEGETLHDRIQQGPLKLEEAVRIASEIASGLEAAHKKNIVHRDIKSQNVMLTEEGSAKVLDFGLAQTAQSTKLTRVGSTLGTVAYMSPEQARGEEVDLRTDLWSLGIVLYEMISGKSPFPGDYEQAVVYEILNQDPEPLTAIRTAVPMELEQIVDKCLQKDKKHRYQHADELVADLSRIETSTHSKPHSITGAIDDHADKTTRISLVSTYPLRSLMGVAVLMIALSFLASWFIFKRPGSSRPDAVAATVELIDERGRRLELTGIDTRTVAISPGGSKIVFGAASAGLQMLYLREVGSFYAKPISGTEGGGSPAFSPDGRWLAYCDDRFVYKVLLDGGLPTAVADVGGPFACRGITWLTNNSLVFVPNLSTGLHRVSSDGSSLQQITEPDRSNGEISHRWPHALPDQKGVVFTIKDDRLIDFGDATIAIYDTDSGSTTLLFAGGTDARVIDPGVILYARDHTLMAATFDIGRREVIGAHQPVVDSVYFENASGVAHYDVSKTGTLIFRSILSAAVPPLVIRNDQSVLYTFDDPPTGLQWPRLSPDGQRAVVRTTAANNQLLLLGIDRPEYSQFTRRANNDWPGWTPDGEWITFISDRDGPNSIYRKSVTTDSIEVLYSGELIWELGNWTPDGKSLFFTVRNSDAGRDIWMLTYEHGWTASPLIATADDEFSPRLSPDGSLLLNKSLTESGSTELYVRRFPELSDRRRISSDIGGVWTPKWDGSGRRVYFVTEHGSLFQALISSSGDLGSATPREILPKIGAGGFDVFSDGQTFLTFADSTIYSQPSVRKLRFISGWTAWLEETLSSN